MSANFDREYRLAAGKAGGMGFEIGEKSKSQPVPLHINFSIERTDLETQNTGRVTVWNLNKEHLATLDEKDCVLSLKAGYGSRMPLIFAGIVTNCVTTHDGADRKTEIEVVDNLVEIRDTYVTISYVGTVNWKTIFDDVANQMGVAVTYSYNAEFADIANGFIWSWMWRRLTEREPTWRRMPSMPSGTPSGRCRMTSTVWLEIAEWWMPSTPSMTFGGVLAP